MYDVVPGWHTAVYPFYYITGGLLSILALILLVWFIVIKVYKLKKESYLRPMNIANLVFCLLSTVLLICYLSEVFIAWYTGYIYEQFSFIGRAIGPYWILYVALGWFPLLLTQLFWRKKYRLNINLALFIVIMSNLHMWFERLFIIFTSLIKDY